MKKVLIYAGTTEGRELAQELAKERIYCDISVATEYGRQIMDEKISPYICILQGRMTAEQMQILKETKKEFEEILESGDVKKIADVDVRFHDIIYEATDNARLVSLLGNMREQLFRYRVECLKNPENYPTLMAEHNAIVAALEARDKVKVTEAMHEHVANQAVSVKAVIQEQDK